MSSNKSEQSLHIEPKKSPQLALVLLAIHGTAMGVLLSLPVNIWLQFALAGSVIGLLIGSWNIYITGMSKKSIKVLLWHEDGNWTLMTKDKHSIDVTLLPSSYVFPKIIVLQFRSDENRKYSAILFPDALNPQLFHRLFLRLKFEEKF